ncbi:MAG: EAL domain-containing protein [Deltaproteobacteria bacterium]|nr:EAL domain-containing protein [Deltaproteobacteria bacterium]
MQDSVNLQSLVELCSDWYWEVDSELRFTSFVNHSASREGNALSTWLPGKKPGETNLKIAGGWKPLRTLFDARKPVRDAIIDVILPDGGRLFVSITGEPLFDEQGSFTGYRCIGRDVTEEKRRQDELLQFRAAMDDSLDLIYIVDPVTMRFIYVNETACQRANIPREEFMKFTTYEMMQVDRDILERMYAETIAAAPNGITTQMRSRPNAEGQRALYEFHRRAIKLGDRWAIVSTSHDVSNRWIAEESVRRTGRILSMLSTTNEAIMHAKTPGELYQQVCEAAVSGGKLSASAALLPDMKTGIMNIAAADGIDFPELREPPLSVKEISDKGRGIISAAFRNGKPVIDNRYFRDAHEKNNGGKEKKAGCAAAVPLIRQGHACGVFFLYSETRYTFNEEIVNLLERLAENVVFALENLEHEDEKKRAEEQIQFLATHDALTGMPNRFMFSQLLSHAVQSAQRYERHLAVIFIDLDRFKEVNDTLGHEAGDRLLQGVAEQLKKTMRTSDVISRMGGDEFVALLQDIKDQGEVAEVAERILSAITKPVMIMGMDCQITGSLGISMYPEDANNEQSLMKNADMAMYFAKSEGRNNYQFYSAGIRSELFEQLELERNLRNAMENKEFYLHYQAKMDFKTGAITGVEALLRWQNPALGSVRPSRLIGLAEDTGLIVPIGRWVLKTACAQNIAWQKSGLPPICMAVNLSLRQLLDNDLLKDIKEALDESGMPPHLLELEITEGMLIQDTRRVIKILTKIKSMGVRLAIDNFGTGYSSLSQITHFPIDTLKVDRAFIRDMLKNPEDKAITKAIIDMGKTLSLNVIAEGVETQDQEKFLREQACDEMQGYYFSKPIPPYQFADLLRKYVPDPRADSLS